MELIGNYKRTMHDCCITETNIEERNSMQVWLQRTVGCIALSSLVFCLVQISGGCVGLVDVCGFVGSVQGGGFGEGVCLCYVQNRPCSSSKLLCDEVWNNLELAIFTGRRRRATIFALSVSRHWKFDQNNALRIFCTWV